MKRYILTFSLCLAFLSPSAFGADGWEESSDTGIIDWSKGYIEAHGQGTSRYMSNKVQEELMAKQAARTVAQARLLEIIKGIRLTGLTTVGVQGAGDMRAATRIKGTLKGAETVAETISWHEDKSTRRGEAVLADVTLRVCLTPTCAPNANLTKASLDLPTKTRKKPKDHTSLSDGIIIDLEKALYLPALAPEIIDEDGKTLYSQDTVLPQNAVENGLVHYAKTIEQAKKLKISGQNPLLIKALRISKDNRIVLSNADAAQLTIHPALTEGRLIVALD